MAAPQVAILGRRSDDLAVRVVGYLATCTSALIWICAAWTNGPSGTPGANLPFFAGLATAFGCAWTARVTLRRGSGFHEEEAALAPAFVFAATGLALWDLSAQSRYAFWMHRAAIGPHWEVLSGFGLALLWTAFAAGLLWWGCAKQEIASRFLAYGIFPAGAGILLVAANADVPLWRPVDNPRFACFLAVSLLWSLGVKVLSSRAELTPGERTFPLFGAAGVAGLLLAGASQELFEGCRWYAHGIGPYWGNAAWDWIAILWQGAALAIFLAGLRRNDMALRYAAYYLGAASILVLLTDSLGASELGWTPVLNVRFLAFLVAANALGGVARLIQRHARELGGSGHDETWLLLPVTLLALVILGWGLTQEAYEWAFTCRVLLGDHWERAAETGISGVWSAYGAILLLAGVLRPNRPQRLLALGLLCATVVKVFLFDLAFLDGPLRILALGGLGVSLLFISWLYSRFGVENRRGMAGLDGWPEVPN